ncbi:hypothetical protein XELAEV_18033162mg [Xenopus laevis]|uniref:Uncharacterized protein n=1 Tax=Xenopus laevis TaxID=8355 RepID=A0A974CK97_XENLA|nr:hypothetical protein XELAEV_18033162mg [Xenopus laevis]
MNHIQYIGTEEVIIQPSASLLYRCAGVMCSLLFWLYFGNWHYSKTVIAELYYTSDSIDVALHVVLCIYVVHSIALEKDRGTALYI